MASIRLATASNIRAFQNLVNALATSIDKWGDQLDPETLQDEFGRFRVWAGNLGALQKGHSSLDYRLRDSPLLSGNTLKFLGELNQNIDEACAIVSGARLPYEDQSKSESAEQLDGDDDDGFFSDDDDDDEGTGGPKRELAMRYSEFVDIIDNLYKLSVRIRTPTIRSRSLRAAAYQPKDPETGIDMMSMYAWYDEKHIVELLRQLRENHVGDAQTGDDYLSPRLAHGVTLRRRQFKYWKRHRDKLSASTIIEESLMHGNRPEQQANVPLRNNTSEVLSPQPAIIIKAAPSQKTGITMLSGTEATHHHQSLDDMVDTKSVTSYAVTVTDINGKGVNLPPPPKVADGERDFECPYCYIICPARYGRGRSWRTHLLQDLQPYSCTYPDCDASDQLFRSRREWNEHEASHRKAWRCLEHPSAIYSSQAGLEGHLRQQHLDSFPENQLGTMIKLGETSTVEMREKCPICYLPADAEGMGDFANHVANHLERIAAFALPNSSEEDADGASSAASRGRSGSTISQNVSSMSLPSDASDEEEQREELSAGLGRSDEEPHMYEKRAENTFPSQSLLSMESLLSLPEARQDRLDALLASQSSNQDDDGEDDDGSLPGGIEEHLERVEEFRTYFLSLPGAQTVRFFRRYGLWRGHAIFENSTQAAQAMDLFDKALWPQVNVQQGTASNRNRLKFSVLGADNSTPPLLARQSTYNTNKGDNDSMSSISVNYEDDKDIQSKAAVLSVVDIPPLRELYRTRKLLQRDQSFAPNSSYNQIISFYYYDLTRLKVDAIVNSANNSMKVSKSASTLNYCIHKAGGPSFSQEARSKGPLKSGQAALTGGHNLPCSYVIHASRPQYSAKKGMGQFNVLTECYRSALRIALAQGLKSIAFPCLGAGGCGFPPRVAARVALQEVREFLDAQVHHSFEQIVFVVNSASDEKAYMDLFPVFFPPTHGDLEFARSSEQSANRATLAAQALNTRLQVQKAVKDLSAELNLFVPNFPHAVLDELHGIDSALASIREFLLGKRLLEQSLGDLSLLCTVLQTVCRSIEELTESAKNVPFSSGHSHKRLWDEYNNHHMAVHDSDLEQFLKDCQDFASCIDNILTQGGTELDEMASIRLRLDYFKDKQESQDIESINERVDNVLHTRGFQREAIAQTQDVVRLDQIPTIAQLYSSNKLGEKSTMVRPSAAFNQTVCLVREDITKLDVTILVNSTDISFAGMGTLDRKIFNKGGLELREECKKFGMCKEGDVRTTPGFSLPAKYVLHVVPPEQYRKNSKDVLRQIYREILHTAQSLQATSIAIPAIGTGMLSYPRRDCASLAMEEVIRFLETSEPSNPLEKIVLVVYSSNDEFVYKSLLPVYFPPIDQTIARALPASHPIPIGTAPPPEVIKAPRRTLFSSIGDAVRNLGSSRSKKQPVSQTPRARTPRAINNYEEHALIRFESHVQVCRICKTMEQLYLDGNDLCEHGYPLAQTLLWYMNLGPDQLVYTKAVQNRESTRLEVPEDMFPFSLTLLRLVEASLKEEGREHPFVNPKQTETPGYRIYRAEKTRAFVEVWSLSEQMWSPISPAECNVFIRPTKIDVYESHAPYTELEPLMSLRIDPSVKITKHPHQPGLILHGTGTWRTASDTTIVKNSEIMLLSQSIAESDRLLAKLHRASPQFPVTRDDLDVAEENVSVEKVERSYEDERFSTGSQVEIATSITSPVEKAAIEPRVSATATSQEKVESDSEQDPGLDTASSLAVHTQDVTEGYLSPLQAKMQRLSEAAARFDTESSEQQAVTIGQLGEQSNLPSQQQSAIQAEANTRFSQKFLTNLELQILRHLSEDLKTRPGSYIGQNIKDIASAFNEPLEAISPAIKSLAKQDYIHNTIDDSTWVLSEVPKELPALDRREPEIPAGRTAAFPAAPVTQKTAKTDLLFEMDLLESQVMSLFGETSPDHPVNKGYKAQHVAAHIGRDISEVESALDQLAEQGKLLLAPDGEIWSIPHAVPKPGHIRDPKAFHDTPSSPVLAAAAITSEVPPVHIFDVYDLETMNFEDLPPHRGPIWTRIDHWRVDPQVLIDAQEEYHEEGEDTLILHRLLRRGELKRWMEKTEEIRQQYQQERRNMGSIRNLRGATSGHAWLDKGRDERDIHQTNLDRVLAGDMKEDELRHFAEEEEGVKRRRS